MQHHGMGIYTGLPYGVQDIIDADIDRHIYENFHANDYKMVIEELQERIQDYHDILITDVEEYEEAYEHGLLEPDDIHPMKMYPFYAYMNEDEDMSTYFNL